MKNIHHKGTKVLVCGSSGTGKTTFLEKYIAGCWHKQVFVFDHQGEIFGRLNIQPFNTLEDLAEYIDKTETEKQDTVLIYDPSDEYPGKLEDAFDDFASFVFNLAEYKPGPLLFVCDEIQQITGPYVNPLPLKRILQTGRRRELDCLMLSQQPNEIHNSIRNQTTELVLFSLVDRNAVKFGVEFGGADEDELKSLNTGHFIHYNRETGVETRAQNIIG